MSSLAIQPQGNQPASAFVAEEAPLEHQAQLPKSADFTSRICSIRNQVFFQVYAFLNPPPYLPPRQFYDVEPPTDPCEMDEPNKPTPYVEARANIASMTQGQRGSSRCLKHAFYHLAEYDDPAFRLAQARKYLEEGVGGKGRDEDIGWCTTYLCSEEVHALYRSEYKPRYRAMIRDNDRWGHNFLVAQDAKANRVILNQHKQEWDRMSAWEKTRKTCLGGRPIRYLLAAAGTSAVVGTVFFFDMGCRIRRARLGGSKYGCV